MAAREKDPLLDLETLARDTEGLCPTNEFSAAVMAAIEKGSAENVLANAQRETANIAPTDDFVAAVMQSVEQGSRARSRAETGWHAGIVRFSRFALMTAAAAAAFCLWLSNQAESSFDATILEGVASIDEEDE
jgi:hypothetical protein